MQFNYTAILALAELAHEVIRAYCRALGDDSLAPWREAPDWQQSSAIQGVYFHLENPVAGPEASHENWMRQQLIEGWTWGPEKNAALKQHPCIKAFGDLPREQQAMDYIFQGVVHAVVGNHGFVPLLVEDEGAPAQAPQAPLFTEPPVPAVAPADTLAPGTAEAPAPAPAPAEPPTPVDALPDAAPDAAPAPAPEAAPAAADASPAAETGGN